MKERLYADKSADELGLYFRNICEGMDGLPINRMHQAISTPKYFAASVHPAITWEGMANFGMNVFLSLVCCAEDTIMPNFNDGVVEEINNKLDGFCENQESKGGRDEIMETYGLKVVTGNTWLFSVAKRTDIMKTGKELREEYNILKGNEATTMAKAYNNILSVNVRAMQERIPDYVA